MKNKNNSQPVRFALNTLTISLLVLSQPCLALEVLPDQQLRDINGQDGIAIDLTYDQINIDKAYWQDHAGIGQSNVTDPYLRAEAHNIVIGANALAQQSAGAKLRLDAGSTSTGQVGLDLRGSLNPALIQVNEFKICRSTDLACSQTQKGIGNLAIQTTSPTEMAFRSGDGLFSKTLQGEMELGIKNANIYLGQTDRNNELNQLIFHNTNFNYSAKGVMFVDSVQGLKLQNNALNADGSERTPAQLGTVPDENYGYVDLNRVANPASAQMGASANTGSYAENGITTNSGLNLEFMLNRNVNKSDPYALNSTTQSPVGAKGLIRLGASGRFVNSSLQIRGINMTSGQDPLGLANNGTTFTTNMVGSQGLAVRMKTEFTKQGDSMLAGTDNETRLEIGGAGLNTYGFEFSNLTGLLENSRGTFDTGDVFINLVDSKSIKLLTSPADYNYVLTTPVKGFNDRILTEADYTQDIYKTANPAPNSLVIAVRGGEFQAFSRQGRFTTTAGVAAANLFSATGDNENDRNQWGLALPYFNLNSNIAIYSAQIPANQASYYTLSTASGSTPKVLKNTVGTSTTDTTTTPRLGLSVALSVDGIDRDATDNKALGSKTTSILLIDGENDYYFGLRNIDMLLKGVGTLGIEKGSLNVDFADLLIAMSAEIGGGRLPTSTYACATNKKCSTFSADYLPANELSDILMTLRLRLEGSMGLSLLANNSISDGNELRILGEFNMAKEKLGNKIQILDPFNSSMFGLDNLVGRMYFNNSIKIGKATNNPKGEGVVSFNTELTFNPNKTKEDVFRIRDVNFYSPFETGASTTTKPSQRLGEIAITGGRLSSQLSIVPRNGAF